MFQNRTEQDQIQHHVPLPSKHETSTINKYFGTGLPPPLQ